MNPMLIIALNDIKDEYIIEANPSDWNAFREESKSVRIPKSKGKALLIAILILLAGITFAYAASYTYTNFFAKWFLSSEMQGQEASFVTGNDAGIVVDDITLKIEALDSVQSGHMIKTAFLVTVKDLDSLLVPDALGPMRGYQFEDGQVLDSLTNVRDYQYLYSCDYEELKDNQMLLIIDSESQTDVSGAVVLQLSNLGYYNKEGTFVRHYDGSWKWRFSAQNNISGKHFIINKDVLVGGKIYHIDDLQVSALGIEVVCHYPGWQKGDKKNPYSEIFKDFSDFATDFSITLSDGSLLPLNAIISGNDSDGILGINALFDTPLVISNVKSIRILGVDYQLQ